MDLAAWHEIFGSSLPASSARSAVPRWPDRAGSGVNPLTLPNRVELQGRNIELLMPATYLADIRRNLVEGETVSIDTAARRSVRVTFPVTMPLRGGKRSIAAGTPSVQRRDPVLIKALRAAHAMLARDVDGMPIVIAAPTSPYQRKMIRLAFLAPVIQQAILAGTQPGSMTLERLMHRSISPIWSEQISDLLRS